MQNFSQPLTAYLVCWLLGLASACQDGTPQPAAADAGLDAGAAQSMLPGTLCSGALPVMSVLDAETFSEVAPDWSCYAPGSAPESPPAARTVSVSVAMSAAGLIASVDRLMLDVFHGPSTLGAPAHTLVLQGDQTSASVEVPAGVSSLSTHVHGLATASPQLDVAELREYDVRIPASSVVEAAACLTSMITLAGRETLGGGTPDPALASISADVRDCQGRDVGGAQLELIDGATGEPVNTLGEGGPRSAYSRFAIPDPSCTFTTVGRAEWVMVNAPVNTRGDARTHAYRLRLRGRMRAQDREPVLIAERELELFAGASTVVRLYRQTDACEVVALGAKRCR